MFSMHSREKVEQAIITAAATCFLMAVLTIVFTVIVGGDRLDGSQWALTGLMAALYAGFGIGTLKKSRIAVGGALALFVIERLYILATVGLAGSGLVIAILVVGALGRGTFAMFRYHDKYVY